MVTNMTMSILPSPPFWNWTRILHYDRNSIKHDGDVHDDDDDDTGVTYVLIVGMGILVMIVMWIFHKYSKEDRPRR